MLAKIYDNQIVSYPYTWAEFESDNNNTNYGGNTDILALFLETDLAAEGYTCVNVNSTQQPSYNWITQGIRETEPVENDGEWYQTWEIYDLTPEQITNNSEQCKNNSKAQAEQLLKDTDWTQMPDVSLINKQAFTDYRAAVRAIALNPPVSVTEWPTKPEEVWVDPVVITPIEQAIEGAPV